MEIYKTNNKNIFYTFCKIDNKEVELDFVLTVENHFYCDVFIQTKKNIKKHTYLTVQQYNFNKHDFVIPQADLNKYLTDRQINNLKEKIKKAYKKILAIKFEQLMNNKTNSDNNIKEYEKYRKYIDIL